MPPYSRAQMHPRHIDFNDESIASKGEESDGSAHREVKIKLNVDNGLTQNE